MSRVNDRRKGPTTFEEQRTPMELTAKAKSPEEISKLMRRSITTIRKLATRLGISFRVK